MGTSSNFGNMISAAGASLFLSFLPMLPTQILLNNLLYDVSEMTIPTDNVDQELLARPAQWDIGLIRRFMAFFGPISSLYDFLTFAVMLRVFDAGRALFRSGWFVESLPHRRSLSSSSAPAASHSSRAAPANPSCSPPSVAPPSASPSPTSSQSPTCSASSPCRLSFLAVLAGMIITYLALAQLGVALFFKHQGGRPLALHVSHRQRRITRIASRWHLWPHTSTRTPAMSAPSS